MKKIIFLFLFSKISILYGNSLLFFSNIERETNEDFYTYTIKVLVKNNGLSPYYFGFLGYNTIERNQNIQNLEITAVGAIIDFKTPIDISKTVNVLNYPYCRIYKDTCDHENIEIKPNEMMYIEFIQKVKKNKKEIDFILPFFTSTNDLNSYFLASTYHEIAKNNFIRIVISSKKKQFFSYMKILKDESPASSGED
jgi:hypothetical protein